MQGNVLGSPLFIGSANSSISVTGSGSISELKFDQSTPNTSNKLKYFTLNRASTTLPLGNALLLAYNGELNVTAGTFNSKGNLTLESNLSGTARIGELVSGAAVAGIVNIERWMIGGASSQRGWRTMSCPVNNDTARYAELLDDILITGPGGSANYFDAARSSSSVLPYEESASRGWKTITTPYDIWPKGKGALVFFRGDRTQTIALTNTNTVPSSFAIDFVGPVNQGNINVNLDFDNTTGEETDWDWNLVGNPYPSQINWTNVSKSAFVDDYYYVINPNTKNYVSMNSGQIAIGQGFFVLAVQSGQTITFNESNKTNSAGAAYFKTANNAFKIMLEKDSAQYDEAWLKFKSGASQNYVFKEDAKKLLNDQVNLSFVADNNVLVQHHVCNDLAAADTFQLFVTTTTNGVYKLKFEHLESGKNYFIVDTKLNLTQAITATTIYSFQINNTDSTTFGKRFKLIIKPAITALAVKLLSFDARKTANGAHLTWEAISNHPNQYFDVEVSTDQVNFKHVAQVNCSTASTKTSYFYTHATTFNNEVVYYRLKITQEHQPVIYSKTVAIYPTIDLDNPVTIYPNPTTDWLNINVAKSEQILNVDIFDTYGQLLLTQKTIEPISTKNLIPGIYTIAITSNQQNKNYVFVKK